MSAAVPVLTALLLMAFAGVLLQRYSPAFALLLSLGAAVWLLLRLAQPLRGVLQAMVQLGAAHQCASLFPAFCAARASCCWQITSAPSARKQEQILLHGAPGWRGGVSYWQQYGRCWNRYSRRSGGWQDEKMRPYHLHGNAGFSVQQNRSESCGSRSHTVANLSRQGTCTGRAVCGRPAWHPCAFVCRRTGAIAAGYDATICRCSAVFVAGSWTCISLAGHCDRALLELAAAGGCGVLLWQELDKLAAALCTRMAGWKSYLLGFLPVYSGVLAAGGEWNAGAAANGFLLTVLCFIAQAVTLWLQPLLRSYLPSVWPAASVPAKACSRAAL